VVLDPVAPVSMNCWGFQVEVFDLAEKMFHEFVAANYHNPGAEIYIALLVTELIERKLGKVKILPGGKTWFGVTYQEDKQTVSSRIRELVQRGDYPQKLW